MKYQTWSALHCALPVKLYRCVIRSIAPKKKEEGDKVTTDLTGKFCYPDGHAKSSVEIGKVINHSLGIGSVTMRSQMIKLAKKRNVETM